METFRNSRRRGLSTTVRWSVPAFLLQTPGVLRRFGEVRSEPQATSCRDASAVIAGVRADTRMGAEEAEPQTENGF